jgi:putative Ca2+/H+ antiporter (TMEM165/GDT1 family)
VTNDFTTLRFDYVLLAAYWTVLIAELVGDKSIYTVSSLALRFRTSIVGGALVLAFAGKMLVAVLLGRAVVHLHFRWLNLVSAGAFFLSAMLIWFDEPKSEAAESAPDIHWARAAVICFASVFFSEWGDPGQIAAAALAAKAHSWIAPWLGGTLAMVTKGALAMTLGQRLRDLLPQWTLRSLASASCGFLGVLAMLSPRL